MSEAPDLLALPVNDVTFMAAGRGSGCVFLLTDHGYARHLEGRQTDNAPLHRTTDFGSANEGSVYYSERVNGRIEEF